MEQLPNPGGPGPDDPVTKWRDKMNRRDFLTKLGVGAGVAGLAAMGLRDAAQRDREKAEERPEVVAKEARKKELYRLLDQEQKKERDLPPMSGPKLEEATKVHNEHYARVQALRKELDDLKAQD